ncbi:MAG: fibronectin type III-like domain-contianing protein, partial [Lachnospiraceae bacterium]|nr:fibronectin type III-like domain-contianing protein [Lachnospiraceae bacterium]
DESFGEKPGENKPFRQLKGFEKVFLEPGETKTVRIEVPLSDITFWNYFRQKMRIEPGEYIVELGPDSAHPACEAAFTIEGEWEAPLCVVYAEADRCCYLSGETGHVRVTAARADASRVDLNRYRPVFVSSDESVAQVDENGTIRAVSQGTARITARVTADGTTAERSVPVAVR